MNFLEWHLYSCVLLANEGIHFNSISQFANKRLPGSSSINDHCAYTHLQQIEIKLGNNSNNAHFPAHDGGVGRRGRLALKYRLVCTLYLLLLVSFIVLSQDCQTDNSSSHSNGKMLLD